MSRTSALLPETIQQYVREVSSREPEILRRLREETAAHPRAIMQVPPEQGQFLALLVTLVQARKALEVGVFTGYSALSVAFALPPEGRLIACDISEEFTQVARRYWAEAGVEGKIDLRLGPAADTLTRLLEEGQAGTFDFAFIDADKPGYPQYYELTLQLVRPGGLIVLDNMLQKGRVTDPEDLDPQVEIMRALNLQLLYDHRIQLSLLPLADGVTLALKL